MLEATAALREEETEKLQHCSHQKHSFTLHCVTSPSSTSKLSLSGFSRPLAPYIGRFLRIFLVLRVNKSKSPSILIKTTQTGGDQAVLANSKSAMFRALFLLSFLPLLSSNCQSLCQWVMTTFITLLKTHIAKFYSYHPPLVSSKLSMVCLTQKLTM